MKKKDKNVQNICCCEPDGNDVNTLLLFIIINEKRQSDFKSRNYFAQYSNISYASALFVCLFVSFNKKRAYCWGNIETIFVILITIQHTFKLRVNFCNTVPRGTNWFKTTWAWMLDFTWYRWNPVQCFYHKSFYIT